MGGKQSTTNRDIENDLKDLRILNTFENQNFGRFSVAEWKENGLDRRGFMKEQQITDLETGRKLYDHCKRHVKKPKSPFLAIEGYSVKSDGGTEEGAGNTKVRVFLEQFDYSLRDQIIMRRDKGLRMSEQTLLHITHAGNRVSREDH